MAGWISSKLKVAETLLQQIDQQAAESLRKGESRQWEEDGEGGVDGAMTSPRTSGTPPLRDQLKKKNPIPTPTPTPNHDNLVNSRYQDKGSSSSRHNNSNSNSSNLKEAENFVNKPNFTLKDSDWTELLNTPKRPMTGSKTKDRGKLGNVAKGHGKLVGKTGRKVGYGNAERETPVIAKEGDERRGADSKMKLGRKDVEGLKSELSFRGGKMESFDSEKEVGKGKSEGGLSEEGKRAGADENTIGGETFSMNKHNGDVAKDELKSVSQSRSSSGSDNESDSESSSDSDSGEGRQREERRQRRRQILAAKAAAKAAEAIKEQENVVARLEGEKQSLEKILEEQSNQAAQEV